MEALRRGVSPIIVALLSPTVPLRLNMNLMVISVVFAIGGVLKTADWEGVPEFIPMVAPAAELFIEFVTACSTSPSSLPSMNSFHIRTLVLESLFGVFLLSLIPDEPSKIMELFSPSYFTGDLKESSNEFSLFSSFIEGDLGRATEV